MPTLHNISNDMYTAGMNKLDGKDFYGSYVVDTDNGHKVCNECQKNLSSGICGTIRAIKDISALNQ